MRFRRLHESLGVEVLDLDVLSPTAPEDVESLQRAFDEHQLLLFRGGARIAPERQVEMAGWFGPLIDDTGDGRQWGTLTNRDGAGRIQLPFHSDFTYTDTPVKGISLHALEVPPSGATTAFVSGIWAWSTLPRGLREVVDGKTARHTYESRLTSDHPSFVAHHPVRLDHPRTGTPLLFVTEFHADLIDGVDPEESNRLLGELFGHLYRPESVYVHRWQRYDLVIWDNLALQHARLVEADLADGERTFQRVALNDCSYPELIERARRAEARSAS